MRGCTGKTTARVLGESDERRDDALELVASIDVRRPMQRDEDVLAAPHAGLLPRPAGDGGVLEATQRVDHRVAHEVDARWVDPLGLEVGRPPLGCA